MCKECESTQQEVNLMKRKSDADTREQIDDLRKQNKLQLYALLISILIPAFCFVWALSGINSKTIENQSSIIELVENQKTTNSILMDVKAELGNINGRLQPIADDNKVAANFQGFLTSFAELMKKNGTGNSQSFTVQTP
jgi:hypothetical protein